MSGDSGEAKKGPTPPGGASSFDIFNWSNGPGPEEAPQCRMPSRTSMLSEGNSFADHNARDCPLPRPAVRMQQPAGGNSTITFGQPMTPEESDAIYNRRPFSDLRRREMSGSRAFKGENSGNGLDLPSNGIYTPDQSAAQCNQQAAGKPTKTSSGADDNISHKKATSLSEVAKQKELNGTQSTYDDYTRKQYSEAKAREFIGNDIFGPPVDLPQRSSNHNWGEPSGQVAPANQVKEQPQGKELAPRNVRTSVKVSNPAGGRSQIILGQDNLGKASRKGHDQKAAELSGNNIFKGDHLSNSVEKPVSVAKLREMSGNDIFSDGKAIGRDSVGGIRKPPGGGSSLSLV